MAAENLKWAACFRYMEDLQAEKTLHQQALEALNKDKVSE